jgi:hypothetical protein
MDEAETKMGVGGEETNRGQFGDEDGDGDPEEAQSAPGSSNDGDDKVKLEPKDEEDSADAKDNLYRCHLCDNYATIEPANLAVHLGRISPNSYQYFIRILLPMSTTCLFST